MKICFGILFLIVSQKVLAFQAAASGNVTLTDLLVDKDRAISRLETAARRGSNEAALKLSNLYFWGREVECNLVAAMKWAQVAADRGDIEGAANTGTFLFFGFSGKKDYAKSFEYNLMAALGGRPHNQLHLGDIFENGQGVRSDIHSALHWYRMAALSGLRPAKQEVAFHEKDLSRKLVRLASVKDASFLINFDHPHCGKFAPTHLDEFPDFSKVAQCFYDRARSGDKSAYFATAALFLGAGGHKRDVVSAFQWMKKAGEANDPRSYLPLASMYRYGEGTVSDGQSAVNYYLRAQEKQPALAHFGLAEVLLANGGVQDLKNAEVSLLKSAAHGYAPAHEKLGLLYFSGRGSDKQVNCELAEKYLSEAARGDLVTAQFHMGEFYSSERCSKNPNRAFAWFMHSAKNGHSAANARVAFMFLSGDEVAKDETKARESLEIAFLRNQFDGYLSEMGSEDAAYALGAMKLEGIGGKKDVAEGMRLLGSAAAHGSVEAQRLLSDIGDSHLRLARTEFESIAYGVALGLILALYGMIFRRFQRNLAFSGDDLRGDYHGAISDLPQAAQAAVLNSLPAELDETLVSHLPETLVAELAKRKDRILAPIIFSHIPSDVQARMLALLPDDRFSKIVGSLKSDAKAIIGRVRGTAKVRANLRLVPNAPSATKPN